MADTRASSHVSVPNYQLEAISDEGLIRVFLLDLGASGRAAKTTYIYGDSVKRLSAFGRELGFPPLALMDKDHVRHWLSFLHQTGNKPATVHVRYRSVNRAKIIPLTSSTHLVSLRLSNLSMNPPTLRLSSRPSAPKVRMR